MKFSALTCEKARSSMNFLAAGYFVHCRAREVVVEDMCFIHSLLLHAQLSHGITHAADGY
jgi:hypothetical protein